MFEIENFESFVRVNENGKSVFDVVFSYGLTDKQKAEQLMSLYKLVGGFNATHPAKKNLV